jgi:hypothetical protein
MNLGLENGDGEPLGIRFSGLSILGFEEVNNCHIFNIVLNFCNSFVTLFLDAQGSGFGA